MVPFGNSFYQIYCVGHVLTNARQDCDMLALSLKGKALHVGDDFHAVLQGIL